MRIAKCPIWIEVKCSRCEVLGFGGWYRNRKTIARAKEQTRDWASSEDYSMLCPKCLKATGGKWTRRAHSE